jgi:preprotein translocase subunit SecG
MLLGEIWPWLPPVLDRMLLVVGIGLILVVLVQRGKGGGLAGALGGAGGSSAFGSRAGDLFTRITIGVAALWIILAMVEVLVLQQTAKEDKDKPTFELSWVDRSTSDRAG